FRSSPEQLDERANKARRMQLDMSHARQLADEEREGDACKIADQHRPGDEIGNEAEAKHGGCQTANSDQQSEPGDDGGSRVGSAAVRLCASVRAPTGQPPPAPRLDSLRTEPTCGYSALGIGETPGAALLTLLSGSSLPHRVLSACRPL